MAARDFYHDNVRFALEKSGWTITDDPLYLSRKVMGYEVDFGAEQLFAAEKGPEKIAVEVKNFIGPSKVNELHKAMGQFNDYAAILEEEEPERILFLAIPIEAWQTFFKLHPVQLSLGRIQAKVMVFDPEVNEIIEWKSY